MPSLCFDRRERGRKMSKKKKPTGMATMRKIWNENKELEHVPSTVSMSECTRKRYFQIFPNAEKRYLEYINKKK